MERRLAAILAADVVGYSRLVEADEEATIAGLRVHREAIYALVISHHGRVFGGAGDSVIAEFASPVEAVRCAVAIQRDVQDRNPDLPENRRMRFRIGVNLGDVIIDGDNLLGDGVNVAARLESLAGPAEVCISRPIFDQVHKQLPFGYEDLGKQQVKNLDEPIEVYRVSTEKTSTKWKAPNDAGSDRGRFALPDRPSVAVLSLDTFSDEEEQRFLAEGIAEDIITELARNTELTVMARTATFAFKDKGLSGKEIANKLGVHYVLEGSVRRAGEQLRITAQLIDAKSGNHVWAQRYDIAVSEIYESLDDIVENIVGTLFSEIRETEKVAILRRPPSNLDVYELTLRGLARKHRLSAKSMQLAREDLLRAVELDPEYAPARLYLGWVEVIAIIFKWIDGLDYSDLDDAIKRIEKAIELDPILATAYQALSLARTVAGDVQGALQAARRSIELGPGDADNLLYFSRALASNGEFDQAVAYARRSMALNPSRPSYYSAHLGRALWGRDEFEETNELMNECLTKAPGFTACRIFQIASHIGVGNAGEASNAVAALIEQSPDFTVQDALKSVGFGGDENANKRLAKQLTEAGLPTDMDAPAIQ